MVKLVFRYYPIPLTYKIRKGMSERYIKKILEQNGWRVWRGGLFYHVTTKKMYPNVEKKYQQLLECIPFRDIEYFRYLCHVHHGMPDFICVKDGVVKFVECKLGHEQLSLRQKQCVEKLQKYGYIVEVFKIVDNCTKLRKARVDIYTQEKIPLDKQMRLKLNW